MMSFVGNDGYGGNKKSVNAYRNRLSFYLRFRAQSGSRTRGLEITIICWNLLAGSESRQNETVRRLATATCSTFSPLSVPLR